ncbi:hypothetical protein SeLEV6574_g06140 [Synchytrium endobioticum]|uniref:EF-hand domain-containing protein n=1 Tax=Synchytrium endobioticum TaxID=286115 RepID=A0A507CQH2_9FUNG|nr:hypothetical protein SeLEV6574_g06140 [Synchytrium endobioticum]
MADLIQNELDEIESLEAEIKADLGLDQLDAQIQDASTLSIIDYSYTTDDTNKITPNDIKNKLESLQPNLKTQQPKLYRLLLSSAEDVNREGMSNLIVQLQRNGWDWNSVVGETEVVAQEALSFFQPSGGPITRDELRRIAALFSPHGLPWKEDVDTLLKLFDKDGDGVIGMEDFKAMSIPNSRRWH